MVHLTLLVIFVAGVTAGLWLSGLPDEPPRPPWRRY